MILPYYAMENGKEDRRYRYTWSGNWRKEVTTTTARRDCFRAGNRTSGNEAGDLMLTRMNVALSVSNKWVRMRRDVLLIDFL